MDVHINSVSIMSEVFLNLGFYNLFYKQASLCPYEYISYIFVIAYTVYGYFQR